MSVGTITWRNQVSNYSFQWNQPCSLLKTAKNLNPTQFQMTYRSQVLQRNMTVSVGPMSLFHTSHYFRLLFTRFFHYWDLWHLISSFMLNPSIDFDYMNISLGGCTLDLWAASHAMHSKCGQTQLMMCIQSLLLIFLVTVYYTVQ